MPSLRILIVLAVLASAAAVAGSVSSPLALTASALPIESSASTAPSPPIEPAASVTSAVAIDPEPSVAPATTAQTYTDPTYGFSFEIPPDVVIDRFVTNEGVIILGTTAGTRREFQIFVSPTVSDEVVTPELIAEQVGADLLTEPVAIALGLYDTGLRFRRENPDFGETFEVVYANAGNLYEITTYPEHGEWLAEILATWRFDNSKFLSNPQ